MSDFAQILNYAAYLLPAIVVGIIANNFFKNHISNEDKRRRFLLHKDARSQVLPLRLQAYERIVLFLERIDPARLLIRVKPFSDSKEDYENLLIRNIEQEFEHNLSQQIYVSPECWNLVNSAKNATIRTIRQVSMKEEYDVDTMREAIIQVFMDEVSPSHQALSFVKKEVGQLF